MSDELLHHRARARGARDSPSIRGDRAASTTRLARRRGSAKTTSDDDAASESPVRPSRLAGTSCTRSRATRRRSQQNLEARIQSHEHGGARSSRSSSPWKTSSSSRTAARVVVQKKVFPGYLLVRCDMDDDSLVRASATRRASPASSARAQARSRRRCRAATSQTFLPAKGDGTGGSPQRAKPKPRVRGRARRVRVKEGPFADFAGTIAEINADQHEAQGAGQHLRPRDPGRDGLQPGRQALTAADSNTARRRTAVMAKKKVAAIVKIQIPAGKATPAPPVGTALGPHGVAIMDFCQGSTTRPPSRRSARSSRSRSRSSRTASFTFILKTPPTPVLLRADGRPRQGLEHPGQGDRRHRSPRPRSTRSPRSRCPTSTPTTSRPPSSRSRGTARSMGITVS